MAMTTFSLMGSFLEISPVTSEPPPPITQLTWVYQNAPTGYGNQWYTVTYGNNKYVALAISGNLTRGIVSADGITWVGLSGPEGQGGNVNDTTFRGIIYGNGQFVAVGSGPSGTNTCNYSTNGTQWHLTSASSPNQTYRAITYGNGLFVAVGYSSSANSGKRAMTTPGLVNGVWQGWTLRDTPEATFEGVAYGNGLFVAVAGQPITGAMVSSDGITWTQSNTVPNNDWTSVAYGNNLFVALSSGGRIMTTQDGINWTFRTTLPPGESMSQIAFGNGLFVTTGIINYQSPDGINWTQCNGGLNGGICYGDGKFVSTNKLPGDSLSNRFAYATWP
jgi:hypothetical protein